MDCPKFQLFTDYCLVYNKDFLELQYLKGPGSVDPPLGSVDPPLGSVDPGSVRGALSTSEPQLPLALSSLQSIPNNQNNDVGAVVWQILI